VKNKIPIKRYGNTIKYVIPLFMPSAIETSPFSTTALHIAHCEKTALMLNINKIKKEKNDLFLNIVRRYH
jgi:hypothetical protein|tara:strand:- start:64 stop:273 length:210 start_codon:yes stop_codon:yes gene_type:complete